MHYFIDGYNMLFRLLHGNADLQSRRESIIQDLNKKISLLKLDASIVFDSTYQIGGRSRSHYDNLEILYSAEGETADEYILDELKNTLHPSQETVITSDKKLAWQARNFSAHTESIEEFILRLNRSYKNKLRQLKKTETQSPDHLPKPLLTKSPFSSRHLNPEKEDSLEAYTEYYSQIFESKWKEIEKEEQMQQKKTSPDSTSSRKKMKRIPRQRPDPFKTQETPEIQAATEMERWLKLFEK
jgi:uncharacterized protein